MIISIIWGNHSKDFQSIVQINEPLKLKIMKKFTLAILMAILMAILSNSMLHAQIIKTFAGGGNNIVSLNSNFKATDVTLNETNNTGSSQMSTCFDKHGNLYICQTYNNLILKVDAKTNVVSIVAGNGQWASNGDDGLAINASVGSPFGIAVDSADNLYIADNYAEQIRMVNAKTGIITKIAGTGDSFYGASGQILGDTSHALFTALGAMRDLAFDKFNNLYVSAWSASNIYKIKTSTNIITKIAGLGWPTFITNTQNSGDGSLAINAPLAAPMKICLDTAGNIYIADSYNQRIRKVNSQTGIITTVAGTGTIGFSGDGGLATNAELNYPAGISIDATGNLYVSDYHNNRILKIDATTGIINTIVGSDVAGFYGDGRLATKAKLNGPQNTSIDANGNIYIADSANYRIRVVYIDSTKESYICTGFSAAISGTKMVQSCYGTLTANVLAGTLPYTYSWSNAMTTPTINNLCIGDYTLQVTDSVGCVAKDSTTIVAGQAIQLIKWTTNASADSCNGVVGISVSRGAQPYMVQLSNTTTSTTGTFTKANLCPGFYNAIITDAIGNRDSITFVIASATNVFNDSTIKANYKDSSLVATLNAAAVNYCNINYNTIDSIYISSYSFIGQDSINVIWEIINKTTPATFNYISTQYHIGQNGVYNCVLQMYCNNNGAKMEGGNTNVVQAEQRIYVNQSTLGISPITESNLQGKTSVYPTPFKDNLNVSFAAPDTHYITVYDIVGNEVTNRTAINGANNIVLNLNALANGIYMIKVETSNKVEFIKTIKN